VGGGGAGAEAVAGRRIRQGRGGGSIRQDKNAPWSLGDGATMTRRLPSEA
jgi:hypothetical protein